MNGTKADKFAGAVEIAVIDHRIQCSHCHWSEMYIQWVFCSTIQPLVDFLSLLT